jgi:hypothetical protein
LLSAAVVDRGIGRVCGFEMACYAAVDLVRKLLEDMSGQLKDSRLSSWVREGESSVAVCFPWCAGQGWDVIGGIVANLHGGSSASSARMLLYMFCIAGVILWPLRPSLRNFSVVLGDLCDELCDDVCLLLSDSAWKCELLRVRLDMGKSFSRPSPGIFLLPRHWSFFDSSNAVRASNSQTHRPYSRVQVSRHFNDRSKDNSGIS